MFLKTMAITVMVTVIVASPLSTYFKGLLVYSRRFRSIYPWLHVAVKSFRHPKTNVPGGHHSIFCRRCLYEPKVSSGFVPNEDQGTIYAIVQTPPGSSLEYTNKVMGQLQTVCKAIEGVGSVTSMAGYEIMTEGRGSQCGYLPYQPQKLG